MDPDALIREYLGRLEAAAVALPAEERAELVGDVRGHIEAALAELERIDGTAVRTVLDRLGAPDEIVAAEAEIDAHVTASPSPRAPDAPFYAGSPSPAGDRSVAVEKIALGMLTVGALVMPVIGPLLGLGFAWSSTRWTTPQKRTAAMVVTVLLVLPVVILTPMVAAGEITAVFSTFGVLVALVPLAGFTAALYLASALYLEVTIVLRRR